MYPSNFHTHKHISLAYIMTPSTSLEPPMHLPPNFVKVRLPIMVMKYHDQKQVEEERVYFSL